MSRLPLLMLVTLLGCGSTEYEAFRNGGGPLCGQDGEGQTVHCLPGDRCVLSQSRKCECVLSCGD